MSLPRFYVDGVLEVGGEVALPAAVAHHALRVLRLRDDDAVILFNGRGGEFHARLRLDAQRAGARVGQFDPVERESPLAVTLVQAWVATEKLDWIAEKAVELGAAGLVLVPAARSVVRLAADRLERRLAHLRQLAIAACEQCGRNRVPPVMAVADISAALECAEASNRLVLAPDGRAGLADAVAVQDAGAAVVLVGPEGGFTADEIALAVKLGCRSVRLGPRVLRTETAGLVALAALQGRFGDLGG